MSDIQFDGQPEIKEQKLSCFVPNCAYKFTPATDPVQGDCFAFALCVEGQASISACASIVERRVSNYLLC